MRQLFRGIFYLSGLVILGLFANFGLNSKLLVSSAQSDFDGCLIEIDRCYQELTTHHMNFKLTRNVEWLYHQALEDFRNHKSNTLDKCEQYAERMCHMWEQSENNRNYTGKDVRNYEFNQSLRPAPQITKPKSTNTWTPSNQYQRDNEDDPEPERGRFEEDDWEYEDCIWEGESEEYCQEFL